MLGGQDVPEPDGKGKGTAHTQGDELRGRVAEATPEQNDRQQVSSGHSLRGGNGSSW